MCNDLKSPNDGKQLEQLVSIIEDSLAPAGFQVAPRKRIYNDSGIQIAELDIVITGKIGSATFTGLIECRDRPSEGPASGSWIEQLVGRRDRFKFDKVMAVSSTGFSQGAKEEAERTGIELRTLKDLIHEDVSHWLPSNAPLIIYRGKNTATRIFIDDENQIGEIRENEERFIHLETGATFSFQQLFQKTINDKTYFDGLIPNGSSKTLTISLPESFLKEYRLKFEDRLCEIKELEFDAVLEITIPKMPLVQASEYRSQPPGLSDEEVFVRIGRWQGSESDSIKEIIFMGIPKQKGKINTD